MDFTMTRKPSTWNTLFLISLFVAIRKPTGCLGAEKSLTTTGYDYKYIGYNVRETTSFIVKVKGLQDALLGLFADIETQFQNQPFYEIAFGGYDNGRSAIWKAGQTEPMYNYTDNHSGFLSNTDFRTFWLSWADHVIMAGYGTEVGKQVILAYDDSSAPMEINFLALSSHDVNSVEWRYYNIEVLHPETETCNAQLPFPTVPVTMTTNDVINDNNPSTCVNVTTTLPSIYMQLLVHEWLPLKVKLLLNGVPSCEKANILVFTLSMQKCSLVSDTEASGMSTCIYECYYPQSTKVTIGFLKSEERPPNWSLCDVDTA